MKKIAIIYSDYYKEVTSNLISVFKDGFSAGTVEFVEYQVFGVSEIPYEMANLDFSGIDAVAVFGCVVEGETYHHELINNYVYNKVYDLSIEKKIPLGYGILNVKNFGQAEARSLLNEDNRGNEACMALKNFLNI